MAKSQKPITEGYFKRMDEALANEIRDAIREFCQCFVEMVRFLAIHGRAPGGFQNSEISPEHRMLVNLREHQ